MSSLLTNVSAMTALKTLSSTNKAIESTQARISTGLAVGEASDNAAYWSIATTMRSDNKALGTVQDALGLGAATVDVAYTAMEATKDVLDEMKTKLVAAKQPGVDKSKIQSEISQLQEQLQGIASASTFSGSNWLNVDSSGSNYSASEKIVSSFTRDSSGGISIGTVDVDMTRTALFDSSATAGGLLEGTAGQASGAFSFTAGDATAGDTVTLAVTVDGGASQNVVVTIDDPSDFTLDDVVAGINDSLSGATAADDGSGNLVLTSNTLGSASSIEVTGVTFQDVDTSGSTFGATAIGFTTIAAATGTDTGGGVMAIDITSASSGELDAYIAQVDTMAESVTTAAADLGAVKKRISMQSDFAGSLMDAVERGIGQLVDADMSEESTRLQALQVQQQLGIQSLSIANSSAQTILSFFR